MKISDILETEPLSKALRNALIFAHERHLDNLSSWLQLELDSYYSSNSAMSEAITVPEYRTVVGAHYNDFGQRWHLDAEFSFINEMRLREGVSQLEDLRDSRQTCALQDPTLIELIAEHLHVKVSSFHVDRSQITGVLSNIRSELFRKLQEKEVSESGSHSDSEGKKDSIFMLEPNFYGIGIKLLPLWDRVKSRKR